LVGGLASLVISAGSGRGSQQLQVQGFDDVHPQPRCPPVYYERGQAETSKLSLELTFAPYLKLISSLSIFLPPQSLILLEAEVVRPFPSIMALLVTAAGQILGAEESPQLMKVLEGKNHESS
jgi:hypothetical protein